MIRLFICGYICLYYVLIVFYIIYLCLYYIFIIYIYIRLKCHLYVVTLSCLFAANQYAVFS